MSEIDFGERCDDHVGEVFPPRCADCAALSHPLAIEAHIPPAALPVARTTDECPTHANYAEPCARCARDRYKPGDTK